MDKEIKQFLAFLQMDKKLSDNTLQSYRRDILQFERYLNDEKINYTEITEENIEEYMEYLKSVGKKTSTISRSLATIRSFYQYLIKNKKIETNPTSKISSPKIEKRVPSVLTSEEVELLLDQPNEVDLKGIRDKAMLEFAYATGMKVTEIMNLNIDDIDLKNATATSRVSKKVRVVPIGQYSLKALKELNNPSYDITPEVITMYISHLIECIYGDKKVSITDLASGSGSLLINIAALVKGEKEITSVDVDSNYVKLQQNIFNLLETNVEIINQDALKPLNIKKQDIVISDVPFGYYADEDNSLNYKLCSTDGYSLNALLFIEQAANYLDENGVGILVIPKKVLELEDNFKKYLEEDINLNAVITLPDEMFKNASQQKAIILITKKGQTRLPNQVFLAQIPSFQNKACYAKFIEEFNEWLANN